MSRSRVEIIRGSLRWMSAATLVAIVPKCILCLAAYAGVGATLGVKLAGPEMCGASASLLEGPLAWFSLAGAAVGTFVFRRVSGSPIRNKQYAGEISRATNGRKKAQEPQRGNWISCAF